MSGFFQSSSRPSNSGLSPSNSGSLIAPGQVQWTSPHLIQRDHQPVRLTVKLMETPLRGPMGVFARLNVSNGHGLIGKHDYVLVEYAPGKWIKAEKVGESSRGRNDAGIKLSLADEHSSEDAEATARFEASFNLGPGRTSWTVDALQKILASPAPDYNVLLNNCWAYAFQCVHAILTWCWSNATDQNVQCEVQGHLERLTDVQRPAPMAVMKAFLRSNTPESAETRRMFRRKLAHTRAHLPDESIVRRGVVSMLQRMVGRPPANRD